MIAGGALVVLAFAVAAAPAAAQEFRVFGTVVWRGVEAKSFTVQGLNTITTLKLESSGFKGKYEGYASPGAYLIANVSTCPSADDGTCGHTAPGQALTFPFGVVTGAGKLNGKLDPGYQFFPVRGDVKINGGAIDSGTAIFVSQQLTASGPPIMHFVVVPLTFPITPCNGFAECATYATSLGQGMVWAHAVEVHVGVCNFGNYLPPYALDSTTPPPLPFELTVEAAPAALASMRGHVEIAGFPPLGDSNQAYYSFGASLGSVSGCLQDLVWAGQAAIGGYFTQYGPGDYDFENLIPGRLTLTLGVSGQGPLGYSDYFFDYPEAFDLAAGESRVWDVGFSNPATLWGFGRYGWANLGPNDSGEAEVFFLKSTENTTEHSSLHVVLDFQKEDAQFAVVLNPAIEQWKARSSAFFNYSGPDGTSSTLLVRLQNDLDVGPVRPGDQRLPPGVLAPLNDTGEAARWRVTGAPLGSSAQWSGSANDSSTSASATGSPGYDGTTLEVTLSPGSWAGSYDGLELDVEVGAADVVEQSFFAPRIQNLQPPAGPVPSREVLVSAKVTANDTDHPNRVAWVTIGGRHVQVGQNGSVHAWVRLAPGPNAVQIEAMGTSGNGILQTRHYVAPYGACRGRR
jgi:hypothetical protein